MPATSTPWVSPTSPTGRRLLMAEPTTLDAVPVLDDATWARLAAEEELRAAVAALDVDDAAATEAPARAEDAPRGPAAVRRVRRLLAATAALAVALVAVAGLTGTRSAPEEAAAPVPGESTLMAMAGQVVAAAGDDGGARAVVSLIAPTRSARWTPGDAATGARADDPDHADADADAGHAVGAVAGRSQPTDG